MSEKTNPSTDPVQDTEGGKDVGQNASDIEAAIDQILADSASSAKPVGSDSTQSTDAKDDVKNDQTQSSDFLETVKKVSGREFKDVSDFEKHYKNLSSFVGKAEEIRTYKQKADQYDKMMQDAEKIAASLNPVQPDSKPVDTGASEVAKVADELKSIKSSLEAKEFVQTNPGAESVLDVIRTLSSSTGKPMQEVYDSTLKQFVEDSKALKDLQSQSKDLGVNSKQRVTLPKSQVIGDIVKQLKDDKTVSKDTDRLRSKLVEEFLDLDKPTA